MRVFSTAPGVKLMVHQAPSTNSLLRETHREALLQSCLTSSESERLDAEGWEMKIEKGKAIVYVMVFFFSGQA